MELAPFHGAGTIDALIAALVGVAAGAAFQHYWELERSNKSTLRRMQAILSEIQGAAFKFTLLGQSLNEKDAWTEELRADALRLKELRIQLLRETWRLQGHKYDLLAARIVVDVTTSNLESKSAVASEYFAEIGNILNPELYSLVRKLHKERLPQ